MISDLLLAVLLTVLWRRRIRPAGSVFWVYLLLYGLARGTIEFWRGDSHRGVWLDGLVSTSQLITAGGALFALLMLVRGWLALRRAGDG
jgi:prolipoprotein diacylglyceryltransferase